LARRPHKPDASGPADRPPAKTGREAAFDAIASQARRFPDLLPGAVRASHLEPREAAFAHALYEAVATRWLTLTAVLDARLRRPLAKTDPEIRAALLGGAGQLLLLGGVPPHAAIDESVNWLKGRRGGGAKGRSQAGLVNAVLRRVGESVAGREAGPWDGGRDSLPLAGGEVLRLAEPVLDEDELRRYAAATGCPPALLRQWTEQVGIDAAKARAMHSIVRPPVVLNVAHAVSPVPDTEPHDRTGSAVFTGAAGSLGELLAERRDVWVQDVSSAATVGSVSDLDPKVVIDMCAGVGTKTRQLAAVFPNAEVIASDQDESKLESLRIDSDRVRTHALEDLPYAFGGAADLVLLDVPCSNTGVLPRRPEARYRAGTEQRTRLADTQRQIVADALRLLAPGGKLLYATCSLEPEENHELAAWAAKWHKLKIGRERFDEPSGLPGEPASRYADGAYSVPLSR